MKHGLRRLYTGIHKTSRKRSERIAAIGFDPLSVEVPGWRKCTTLVPDPTYEALPAPLFSRR